MWAFTVTVEQRRSDKVQLRCHRRSLGLFVLVLLAMASARADPLDDRLRAFIAGDGKAERAVAGLQYALIKDRALLRSGAVGCARFAANGIDCDTAMRPDQLVRIASISKMLVAIAALELVEQQRLDLDRDVSDDLGFTLRNPAVPDRPISLRQLLSHQSSLSDAGGYAVPVGRRLADYLTPTGAHWDPARFSQDQPGSRFSYTNLNFPVVAQMIERAAGARFDAVSSALFDRLKMTAGFNFAGLGSGRPVAALYRKRPVDTEAWDAAGPWFAQIDDIGHSPPQPLVYDGSRVVALTGTADTGVNGGLFSPQGGVRTSAEGLATLALHFLNPHPDGLSHELVDRLFEPQWTSPDSTGAGEGDGAEFIFSYGLGAQIGTGRAQESPAVGTRWVGHFGAAYGLLSGLMINREEGWGLIYLMTGTAAPIGDWPGTQGGLSGWEKTVQAILFDALAVR